MDANLVFSRRRSRRCERERPAVDCDTRCDSEIFGRCLESLIGADPICFLPIFFRGDCETSGAAPVPESWTSSSCSMIASSSMSSSTEIFVLLVAGTTVALLGGGTGAFPHACMNMERSQSPVSLPCRSLSTRWNTVLRKSRSRHAGDSDARFSVSTTCVTEARIRLSSLDVNLRMHFSGSMSQASLESPVHGGVRCGSRSSPRTSEMMCSCGGSCAMARARSVSFSAEPPSRDWRMEASFSCAGPICGRRVREVAPPEAYMEGMDPAPPFPVFLPVMDLLIVDLVAEAGDGTWGGVVSETWVRIGGDFGWIHSGG